MSAHDAINRPMFQIEDEQPVHVVCIDFILKLLQLLKSEYLRGFVLEDGFRMDSVI